MKTCKFAILNKEMEYSMYIYIFFFFSPCGLHYITCLKQSPRVQPHSSFNFDVFSSALLTNSTDVHKMVICSRKLGKVCIGILRPYNVARALHRYQRSWVRIPFRPEFFSGLNHVTTAYVVCKTALINHVFISV